MTTRRDIVSRRWRRLLAVIALVAALPVATTAPLPAQLFSDRPPPVPPASVPDPGAAVLGPRPGAGGRPGAAAGASIGPTASDIAPARAAAHGGRTPRGGPRRHRAAEPGRAGALGALWQGPAGDRERPGVADLPRPS